MIVKPDNFASVGTLKCLCKRRTPAIDIVGRGNGLPIAACTCGVKRLAGDIIEEGVLAQYTSGAYHSSTTRHKDVVDYHARYASDYAVAEIRANRYDEIVGSVGPYVLDVGAANGAFIDFLRREQYTDAWGIEPDPQWAGEFVRTGTIADVGRLFPEIPGFDLITYHDVLEHIVDPAAEVEAAVERLNTSGALILDVPDVAVPEGEKHYKAEHLWYFTARSLIDLVRDAGLTFLHIDFPIAGKMVVYAYKGRAW